MDFGDTSSLREPFEMAASILLPAGFVGIGAEGMFLADAGGANLIGGNTERNEIGLRGGGAAVAEGEVIFLAAALVAVTLDYDAKSGIGAEKFRVMRESEAIVAENVG